MRQAPSAAAVQFTRAIVRAPGRSFAAGLSSAGEGPPDLDRALEQHAAYVRALRDRGIRVTQLPADEAYPDGTFVEDTAIVSARGAILTRPGAPSRQGEVSSIAECLRHFYAERHLIEAPGTLDGGDICEVDGHFLIGVSARTNAEGAQQLARHLDRLGYGSSMVDIRGKPGLLHLKSGIAYLGEALWVVQGAVQHELQALPGFDNVRDPIVAASAEAYAANCVRVNDAVFVAAGYPALKGALERRGCNVVALEMSEFRKMDGGLSCLSLRF